MIRKFRYLFSLPFFTLALLALSSHTNLHTLEERNEDAIVYLKNGYNKSNFLNELRSVTTNFRVKKDLSFNLANGYVIEINDQYLDEIKKLSSVDFATFDQVLSTTSYDEMVDNYNSFRVYDHLDNNSLREMNMVNDGSSKLGEGTLIAVLDSSFSVEHEAFAPLTGEAEANAKYTQEEIQALMDNDTIATGTYVNSKIPFVYDYANDDQDVESVLSTHGMHVSSIATANGAFTGVAPNAQLAFLKVSSDGSSEQTIRDQYIAEAMGDAYDLGADVINLSIGSDLDDFVETATNYLVNRLKTIGTNVNIAAGNSGKGTFNNSGVYKFNTTDTIESGILGSYASATTGTTVASSNLINDNSLNSAVSVLNVNGSSLDDLKNSENVSQVGSTLSGTDQLVDYVFEGNDQNNTTYTREQPFSGLVRDANAIAISEEFGGTHTDRYVDLPYIVIPGIGAQDGDVDGDDSDIKLDNDYASIDALGTGENSPLNGKIAVIRRGSLAFANKVINAVNRGAIAVIIYNYEGSGDAGRMDLTNLPENLQVPIYYVSQDDGENLESKAITDSETNIKYGMLRVSQDQISTFSTDGATSNLEMKVEITAPGEHIAGAINVIETTYDDENYGLGAVNVPVNERTPTYNSYMYLSGTSMASPNYTGAYGLVLGDKLAEHPDMNEEETIEFKNLMKARMMSTAEILFTSNGAPVSTRRQGAGEVDISNALHSPIYLSTAEPITYEDSYNGESSTASYYDGKLELGTSTSEGNIAFDYMIHNEKGVTDTLNVSLYVTVPELLRYDKASETSTEFIGIDFQSTNQRLVQKVNLGTVTLTGEDTQIASVDYTLSDEDIEEIMNQFEDGMYLEGYLTLESDPNSNSDIHVNLPYLGFIGDYQKGSAIEEFDFEKEEGRIYPSDLLNNALEVTGINRPNGNFSSTINVGSNISNVTRFLNNTEDVNDVYLPIHGEEIDGTYHIYAGATGIADNLYIQTFVKRSIEDNTITITREGSSSPVITTNLVDSIYSSGGILYKSLASSDLIASGIAAHRGYTVIDLSSLEEGEYNMTFTFELAAGFTQTRNYVLHIDYDNTMPSITSYNYNNDTKTLDIGFTSSIYTLDVNGVRASRVSDTQTDFTIQLANDTNTTDSVTLLVESNNYYSLIGVTSLETYHDDNTISYRDATLWNGNIRNGYSIEVTSEPFNGFNDGLPCSLYSFYLYNASGRAVDLSGDNFIYTLTLPSEYTSVDIEVYASTNTGLARIDNFIKNGNFLSFTNPLGTSEVIIKAKSNFSTPTNNSTVIIAVSCSVGGVVVLAGAGTGLYFFLKKKKGKVSE